MRIAERLRRDRTFFGVVAFLLALSALNLYWFRHDFAALARQALPGGDPGVARWQAWARHYDRLFGMLAEGERVAFQVEGSHSSSIVIERTPAGLTARRSPFIRRENPGVVLSLGPGTAEELLGSAPGTDPDAIWQMMKDRLYGRQITVWSDPDLDRLERGGYLAFLRAIDTRPAGIDWPTVKARLGEK